MSCKRNIALLPLLKQAIEFSVSRNNGEARPGTNKCGIASQPSYSTISASLGAESYAPEWEEFQAAQDTRNGEIPEAFKDAVELVNARNAPNSTYKLSCTGRFTAMDNAEYKKVSGYTRKDKLYSTPEDAGVVWEKLNQAHLMAGKFLQSSNSRVRRALAAARGVLNPARSKSVRSFLQSRAP